jgi:hypothetical protein
MRRIVYLNPYPSAEITGGIKTAFRHVELLRSIGIDARVFAPGGRPTWFNSKVAIETAQNPMMDSENIVVFPEGLAGPLEHAARAPSPAAKALLCQNQYNVFNELIPRFTYAQLGFVKLMTVSEVAKGFLERILAPSRFEVLPVWVDEALFFPRKKEMRIAVVPHKLMLQYQLARRSGRSIVLRVPRAWD